MIDRLQTVATIVLDHSECAQVFQHHRIDYCCHGDVSVEVAAESKQIDVDDLVRDLSRAVAERHGDQQQDLRALPTPLLVAYIVSKHHDYLRKALPFVRALAAKVSRVHGDHNPKLRDLDTAVGDLSETLVPHLDEEEQLLFPVLIADEPDHDSVAKQLGSMMAEHEAVGKLLERIRSASDEFALPEWACNSYRTLFSELEQLEGDVFRHVHLENHVLQPRFAA